MSDSQNRQNAERIPLLDAEQSELDWIVMPCCEPRRTFGCFENGDRGVGRPALPLAKVDVSASVVDRIASVTVVQKFVNQLKEPIEAVYIFPLSGSSSVSKFQMQVGERTIDGLVKERAEARQEYQAAIEEGKRAAILEQERDDVFTAQVGNIMPGEEITVTIVYNERLTYFASGHTEIRLPLVVAPRYVAGTPLDRESVGDGVDLDTDMVSDASRISPPRLAAGFDPKVSLAINVDIEVSDDVQLEDLLCSQHATKSSFAKSASSAKSAGSTNGAGAASHIVKVALVKEDEHLDRDFVLSWKLAGSELSSVGLISKPVAMKNKDLTFQYGMVSINPPANDSSTKVVARDVVFLLDRSGSMGGLKMTSAARSLIVLLNTLRPDDRFAISAFDDIQEWFSDNSVPEKFANVPFDERRFLPASLKNIDRGVAFLRSIDARGGTEMQRALEDCFDVIEKAPVVSGPSTTKAKAKASTKRQAVVVLITDGEVADESHILKTIQSRIDTTRIFTVGVDTAVNDGFLKRLANLGGGTCTLVPPGDALENALIHVAREIGVPLITDLHFDDTKSFTCAPHKAIDLFEGRPVSIYFQCSPDKLPASVDVVGRLASGGKFKQRISLLPTENAALPQLYAKARISELEDLMRDAGAGRGQKYEDEIVELSIAHSLLTRFTAFLAIDHAEIANAGGDPRKLVQPVEAPAQWQQFAAGPTGIVCGSPPVPCAPASPKKMSQLIRCRSVSSAEIDQSFGDAGAPSPAQAQSNFGASGGSWGGGFGGTGNFGAAPGSGFAAPLEPINSEDTLSEELDLSRMQLDADWDVVLLLLERLLLIMSTLSEIAASGGDDWKKELAELRQIEDELNGLAQTNHLITAHPNVAPVFRGKILPALRTLIDSLDKNLVVSEIQDASRQITLYSEQVRLYTPDLPPGAEVKPRPPAAKKDNKKVSWVT